MSNCVGEDSMKLLSAASEKEKKQIAQYFSEEKLSRIDKEALKNEIVNKLQNEVDSLEEVKSKPILFIFRRTSGIQVFENHDLQDGIWGRSLR